MTREEVFGKLRDIFADLLDEPDFELTEDTAMGAPESWDSLLHITLMTTVEDEFGVRFSTGDIARLKSAAALADDILGKLGAA